MLQVPLHSLDRRTTSQIFVDIFFKVLDSVCQLLQSGLLLLVEFLHDVVHGRLASLELVVYHLVVDVELLIHLGDRFVYVVAHLLLLSVNLLLQPVNSLCWNLMQPFHQLKEA